MHLPRRLAVRVLVLGLVAGCAPDQPDRQTVDVSTPAVVELAGRARPDPLVLLPDALAAAQTSRWFAYWAAQPPPPPEPAPRVVRPPRAIVARSPASPSPPVELGDRFDRLAVCESGGDPTSVSSTGRFRGAFQFTLPSWRSSGETGDPVDYSYSHQKAAAVRWAGMTNPASQWPVCWPRSA